MFSIFRKFALTFPVKLRDLRSQTECFTVSQVKFTITVNSDESLIDLATLRVNLMGQSENLHFPVHQNRYCDLFRDPIPLNQ